MKPSLWSLFPAAALLLTSAAQAKELTCKPVQVARCNCPASMSVQCTGYDQPYYLADTEKAQSATFTYQPKTGEAKTLVLKKPKSSVRDLYAPEFNKEVKALLAKEGIKFASGDTIQLTSFVAKPSLKLYTGTGDEQTHSLKGVPVAKPSGGAK